MLFQYVPYYSGGGAGNLQSVLWWLNNWGLQDLWLPFVLIFTLVFAILQKIKIFNYQPKKADGSNDGSEVGSKKMNGIMALAISLMLAAGHTLRYYPPNMDPFLIITNFIPQTAIAAVAILLAALVLGLVTSKTENSSMMTVFVLIAVAAVLLNIVVAIFPAFAPDWLRFNPVLQAVIVVVAVMGLVIWYITSEDDPAAKKTPLGEWLKNPGNPS